MIDPRHYGLIEIVVVGVIVLALAIWQLVSVQREIGRDAAIRESERAARHPVGEHGLDDRGGEAP